MTCQIIDCIGNIRAKGYCYKHYMKWYRYGDALYQKPETYNDISGNRFGMLLVVSRADTMHWNCLCDCGKTSVVLTGDLNRGSTTSCGDRSHRRGEATYERVHSWVKEDRGNANEYTCVDCSGQALHWSYNHLDPNEQTDSRRGPFGTSTEFYEPRCVSCHKKFDLGRLTSSSSMS